MEIHDSQVRRIALIGMPASGKTSVGSVLAELEGLPFVDLDEAIAIDAGRSISDIFADEGEAGFRVRERAALVRVAAGGPVVLATGGGCIELPENRTLLAERFKVIWLKVDLGVLAERSVGGSRPLLVEDAAGKIRFLYERRKPWYKECADIELNTDGMRVKMVAKVIRDSLR